jgi:UDP-N-acetylmuramate dehydrogenase
MGGGSNLLVSDQGFPGVVIRVVIPGVDWSREDDRVFATAGAGEQWDGFVGECVEQDLAGLECLSAIPGFVGGAPVQNIGAYGQEVSETIVRVRVYDRREKQMIELANADCGFAYRASLFNGSGRNRYVVLAVRFALIPHGAAAIRYPDLKQYFADLQRLPNLRQTREAVRAIRSRKGMAISPDDPDSRSAGSFFKNPILRIEDFTRLETRARSLGLLGPGETPPSFPASASGDRNVKVPAAWLIERAGFQKGETRGPVGLSSKHTLAIINRGGATARDVLALVEEITGRVEERLGVALVPEPVFVGFEPAA